jgi:mono/diheme cytochrome c family protein
MTGLRLRLWWIVTLGLIAVLALISIGSLYAGLFNVAADEPHSQPVYWLLKTTRERSIAARAGEIGVPSDLDDAKRVASGAGQYAEMCSSCHLAPGMRKTEMSRGLYPRAPELRRGSRLTAAEQFWVLKHGLKMTGMPAWGVTHGDTVLWDVVAFLKKLPDLTAEEYQALVKSVPTTHNTINTELNHGDGTQ